MSKAVTHAAVVSKVFFNIGFSLPIDGPALMMSAAPLDPIVCENRFLVSDTGCAIRGLAAMRKGRSSRQCVPVNAAKSLDFLRL
jgi:hypothetical protein